MNLPIVNQPPLTVADVARRGPAGVRVLQRHGLDFCCGGKRPLEEVCAERGIAPEVFMAELAAEEVRTEPSVDWTAAPLGELLDHILSHYHRPLDEELPRLGGLARKVHSVHRERAPAVLDGVLEATTALIEELIVHMAKEEQILFPWIRRGGGAALAPPIRVMEAEHDHAGALFKRLRQLTGDYQVPPNACASWRALWQGLEGLERETHAHIHLENNILFPRALRGA